MAEEMTTPPPPQTVPAEADSAPAAPAAAVPAAAPAAAPASAAPRKPKKDSPLLPILTVFLIMVGIADAVLWGVAGYYFFQNSKSETPAVQDVSAGGAPAQNTASGGGETSDDDEAKREALEAYIREIADAAKVENEMRESQAKAIEADAGADAYVELTERTIPLCQQLNERVLKITSRDPEIGELCEMYRDYVTKYLNSLNTLASAVENEDTALVNEANVLVNEASDVAMNHVQKLQALAEERNVSLNG